MKFNEIKRMLAEDPWDLFYRLSKSEAQKIFTEAIYSLRDDQSYEEFIDSIEEIFDDGQELSFMADDGRCKRKTYAEYRKQEEDFRYRLLEKDPGLKYDDSEIDKAIFYKWLEEEIFNSNKQDQNSKIESILK